MSNYQTSDMSARLFRPDWDAKWQNFSSPPEPKHLKTEEF